MKILLSFFILLLVSLTTFAHNVVGGVYASGADIEGEAGFSNGKMANAGTLVKVFDQAGIPLGEVITDDDGFFVFSAKNRITHVFEINMGAGHHLTMQLPAEELPESLDKNISATNKSQSAPLTFAEETKGHNNVQMSLEMLEKVIAKQIKPLRKEIQALKEKSGFRDMIGGVGYIFGLLGLVAFLRERKLRANKPCHKD
jgi:nickel transport protein